MIMSKEKMLIHFLLATTRPFLYSSLPLFIRYHTGPLLLVSSCRKFFIYMDLDRGNRRGLTRYRGRRIPPTFRFKRGLIDLGAASLYCLILLLCLFLYKLLVDNNSMVDRRGKIGLLLQNYPSPSMGCDRRIVGVVREIRELAWDVHLLYEDPSFVEDSIYPQNRFEKVIKINLQNFTKVLSSTTTYEYLIGQTWFWTKGSVPIFTRYWEYIEPVLQRGMLKLILFHDDAHLFRNQDVLKAAYVSENERLLLDEEKRKLKKHLPILYDAAYMNVFITEEDRLEESKLSSIHSQNSVVIGIDIPEQSKSNTGTTPFEDRWGFLFVGNGHLDTNYYSLDWFFASVWPEVVIRQPNSTLHIIGHDPSYNPRCSGPLPISHCDLAISSKPGTIKNHGFVSDISSIASSVRAIIAPIRYGTGVNTKVLLGLEHKIPVIATQKASRGLPCVGMMVANSTTDFYTAMLRIHNDSHLWKIKQREFQQDTTRKQLFEWKHEISISLGNILIH